MLQGNHILVLPNDLIELLLGFYLLIHVHQYTPLLGLWSVMVEKKGLLEDLLHFEHRLAELVFFIDIKEVDPKDLEYFLHLPIHFRNLILQCLDIFV